MTWGQRGEWGPRGKEDEDEEDVWLERKPGLAELSTPHDPSLGLGCPVELDC